jgi:hypothetical protein
MKIPKIPKKVADVLLELGIVILKTLKNINAKGKLSNSGKLKSEKGETDK